MNELVAREDINKIDDAIIGKNEKIDDCSNSIQIKGYVKAYEALVAGAEEWIEPKLDIRNLRHMTSDTFELLSGAAKKKYVRYYMCFKDNFYRRVVKPAYCNLISIIAYNALNVLNDRSLEELKDSRQLSLRSNLVNSGLFLYQSSDDKGISSTYEPDGYLEFWIPKDEEDRLIKSNPYKAEYSINSFVYPMLSGVIMSFNDMKELLLNPNVIACKKIANVNGFHDMHSLLHRDITNNNMFFQDINLTDDVILEGYRLYL